VGGLAVVVLEPEALVQAVGGVGDPAVVGELMGGADRVPGRGGVPPSIRSSRCQPLDRSAGGPPNQVRSGRMHPDRWSNEARLRRISLPAVGVSRRYRSSGATRQARTTTRAVPARRHRPPDRRPPGWSRHRHRPSRRPFGGRVPVAVSYPGRRQPCGAGPHRSCRERAVDPGAHPVGPARRQRVDGRLRLRPADPRKASRDTRHVA
jgi:hypothetical protein